MKSPPLDKTWISATWRMLRQGRVMHLLLALLVVGLVACGDTSSGANGGGGADDMGQDRESDGQVELDLPESPDLSPDTDDDAPDAATDADDDALTGADSSPDAEAAPEPDQLTAIIAGGQARSATYSARVRLLPPLTGTTAETGGDDE